jgi:chromosome segregation ATPase
VRFIDNRAKERNKFVDSEIDKLWGVTYRTNRPAIEENQKAIDNNTTTVKQHQDTLKTQSERVELQQSSIAQQQTQIEKTSQTNQLAMKNVQDQLYKIQLMQDKLSGLLGQVAAHEKTLSGQHKTDLGQAQLAQQHAKDLAALTISVQSLSKLVGDYINGDDISKLSGRMSVLENKSRVLTAIEQNASAMDERVYVVEQSIDSVNAFRRDTNRSLDQLQSQIRNLAYGE